MSSHSVHVHVRVRQRCPDCLVHTSTETVAHEQVTTFPFTAKSSRQMPRNLPHGVGALPCMHPTLAGPEQLLLAPALWCFYHPCDLQLHLTLQRSMLAWLGEVCLLAAEKVQKPACGQQRRACQQASRLTPEPRCALTRIVAGGARKRRKTVDSSSGKRARRYSLPQHQPQQHQQLASPMPFAPPGPSSAPVQVHHQQRHGAGASSSNDSGAAHIPGAVPRARNAQAPPRATASAASSLDLLMLTARSTRTSGSPREPGTNCSEAAAPAADAAHPAQHGSLTGLLHGPAVEGRRHQAGTTAAAVPGCVGRDCLEAHQRISRGGGHNQQGLASMQRRDSVANSSLLTLAAQQQLQPEGELAQLDALAEQDTMAMAMDAQPPAPAIRAPANLRHTADSAAAALDWDPCTGAALAAAAHTRHCLTGAVAELVEADEPPLDPGTVGTVVMEEPTKRGCDHDSAQEVEAAGADVAASTVAALQQLQRIALAADRSPEQPGLRSDRLKVPAGLQQALPPAPACVTMTSRRDDSRRQAHSNTQCQQPESASAAAAATVAALAATAPVTGTQQLSQQGQLAVDRLGSALGTMATDYAAGGHNGSHLPDSGGLDDIIALALGASGPAPHPEHSQLPQPPSRPAASGVPAGEGVPLGEQQAAVAAEPGAAIVIPASAVVLQRPQPCEQAVATGPIGPWAASEKALPLLSAGSAAVAGPASESKQRVAAKPAAQLGVGTQQGPLSKGQAAAAGATMVTFGGGLGCDGQNLAVAHQKGSKAQRLRKDGAQGGRVQGGRVQGAQVQGGQVQAQRGGVQGEQGVVPETPGSDLEGGTGPQSLALPCNRSSVREDGHAGYDGSECGTGAVATVAGCAEVCGDGGEQADMVTMDVLAILG